MGYKNEIFEELVDDELKCGICKFVLENPMQGVNCEHLFCLNCIQQWLKNSLICPLDKKQLLTSHLQSPPKIILKLLNNLKIKCNFHLFGCSIKLKLSDLNQHIKICPYDPEINQNECNEITNKLDFQTFQDTNEIKSFRIVGGDLSNEIDEMNKIVGDLNKNLESEYRKSIEFAKNLEIAQQNYANLNQKFKKIVNPFLNFLKTGFDQNRSISTDNDKERNDKLEATKNELIKETNSIIAEERQTCTAIIRNLNEFLNEQIIEEYLRQNDIQILSCELELTIYKRSRDFKVVIYKSDFNKLFSENLWPIGVTCHNLSTNKDNLIIFGKRQTDLPSLTIKSGLALSFY